MSSPDSRNSFGSRLRYWNTNRGSVFLRATEQLVTGSQHGCQGVGLNPIVLSPVSVRVVKIDFGSYFGNHFWRLSSLRKQQYSLAWIKPEMSPRASINSVLDKVMEHSDADLITSDSYE